MSAEILPFQRPPQPLPSDLNQRDEFQFWVEVLDPLPLAEQHRLIGLGQECDVIDEPTAETLHTMWIDREGA